MGKADIIKSGIALGLDYSMTSGCYDPARDGKPCGSCDACLLRAKGFAEAGIPDPLIAKIIRPRGLEGCSTGEGQEFRSRRQTFRRTGT